MLAFGGFQLAKAVPERALSGTVRSNSLAFVEEEGEAREVVVRSLTVLAGIFTESRRYWELMEVVVERSEMARITRRE